MRRVFLLIGWGLLLGLGVGTARADLVDDLLRIHVETLGGRQALADLAALRAIGHSEFGEQRMRFVMWAARPNQIRIESIDATRTQTQAWDGESLPWRQTRGPTGRSAPETMTAEEAAQFTTDANFDDPLVMAASGEGSVDYAGEDVIRGRPVHKLLVMQRFVHLITVYLDAESFLILRQEHTRAAGTNREVVVATDFFDYREVDGVKLPHRLEVTLGGRPWVTTELEQMAGNPLIPPAFFSKP